MSPLLCSDIITVIPTHLVILWRSSCPASTMLFLNIELYVFPQPPMRYLTPPLVGVCPLSLCPLACLPAELTVGTDILEPRLLKCIWALRTAVKTASGISGSYPALDLALLSLSHLFVVCCMIFLQYCVTGNKHLMLIPDYWLKGRLTRLD